MGMTPSEIAGLTDEDYIRMLKSRQRRSIQRNALKYRMLKEKIAEAKKAGSDKPVKTHVREAVILPSWIGAKINVYTGKEFQQLTISANMLGHRLGEFAYSTKRVVHSSPGIRATKGSKFTEVK